MILPYQRWSPVIHSTAYVAPTADVIGRVRLAKDASIWFGSVIRGEQNRQVEDLESMRRELLRLVSSSVTLRSTTLHKTNVARCQLSVGCCFILNAAPGSSHINVCWEELFAIKSVPAGARYFADRMQKSPRRARTRINSWAA